MVRIATATSAFRVFATIPGIFATRALDKGSHDPHKSFESPNLWTEKPSISNLTVDPRNLYTQPAKMENEKGEIVDLYVLPVIRIAPATIHPVS